ncbi:hypothetical protein [Streptomyces sp. NRRL F-5727]|nr:hypothetical protein [Streptomyces sp. NRRL F-5727]
MPDQPDDTVAGDSSAPGTDDLTFDSVSVDFGQEWVIGGGAVSDEDS